MNRDALRLASLGAAAVLAAEWMRAPGWILAAGVGLAALVALAGAQASGGSVLPRAVCRAGALAASLLAAVVLVQTRRLDRVERHWSDVREALVTDASRRLGGELDAAFQLGRTLADEAAGSQGLAAPQSFEALERLIRRSGPSHGVALFDAGGRPVAWAGIQRTAVSPMGRDLEAVTTPFYLWLVARRQTSGGTAVATVLLARSDLVPRAGEALTDRFAQTTGVGLRFYDKRSAPADPDVFDYVRPWLGGDTLFAVKPVPPSQEAAYARQLGGARAHAAWLVLAVLCAVGALGVRVSGVAGLVPPVAALAAIARAPLRDTFGPGSVFSPDTYTQRLLGPFSYSAGMLLLTGVVVFAVACTLWHRGPRPSWLGRAAAVLGTLAAPYLLQTLARGIVPPAGGVAGAVWVTWQLALVVGASALVLLAAALVRGEVVPLHAGRWPFVAGAIALLAAVLGLWLWHPKGAWPEWYPYLWAPALLLALRPTPFRGALTTIAVVAGSSAALLTWGATTEGRMALAARDIDGLGDQAEPRALAILDHVVHEVRVDSGLYSAGDLFVLWRRSALGAQVYPASLAVWGPDGERVLGLDLAELDVPAAQVQQVAREAVAQGQPALRALFRVPGLHGVAALPLGGGRALTITVGPRSRLVGPSRLARFLLGVSDDPEPPYEAVLGPPGSGGASDNPHLAWRREGWTLRGERTVGLPGGTRHSHATIDLRGPAAILQRGALLLVLDVAALVLLAVLVELAAGRLVPALRAWWPRAGRSLRLRLSVSLGLFFIGPTLVLALWSFGRLEEEFRGARELLLQRTLRDAAGVLAADTAPFASAIPVAARRVEAELLLAHDGALAATSAPVLADLGLVDLLLPSTVYAQMVWGDEVELAADQVTAPAPTLIGYRLTRRSEGGADILGVPEFLGDPALRRREADLGIAVLVAAMLGVFAAVVLSGFAARALANPLQQLRRAALAVGAGEAPPFAPGSLPAELEPIGGALRQAAAQVEEGQRAQRVLAWGEMARQIAHEIKNPLTPIRLGVQHLLRLEQERPAELTAALPQTGARILAEIDRLDAIARTFSRFAVPGAEAVPVEAVDLAGVVRDVVNLYGMGAGMTRWEADVPDGLRAMARRDELVEVLVNLCENARDAGATRVVLGARAEGDTVRVECLDNGRGIAAEVRPRIFEPRFSTTTSGSGLGLAIARRLVESWGGTIEVAPDAGPGTTMRIRLRPEA